MVAYIKAPSLDAGLRPAQAAGAAGRAGFPAGQLSAVHTESG